MLQLYMDKLNKEEEIAAHLSIARQYTLTKWGIEGGFTF